MGALDYVTFLAYTAGVFAIGLFASTKVHNSTDLFAAGRQAPWWVAGLSSFMTMFSAATFVVWGSIAYRYGLVAVVVNLTYGVAAILVGFFIAGRWRRLGLTTPAEFIKLRFGKTALTVYTLLNLATKMLTVSVALYSLAIIVSALVPLPDGSPFQDAETGMLSVSWAIVLLGGAVVIYTVAGGLWAVLITDVVQFVVLMVAVGFVAPLIVNRAGGLSSFVDAAPEGFFRPTQGEWTWWILAGWCAIQFAMIGAEWAFVQRYLCVSSPRDAKKSAWLFGALYLTSPLLWMLPPMVYRTIDPTADPEQAYILACQAVLPAGMVGLVLAAMASATASLIDSQLNVFAGVLTSDFYKPFMRPGASDKTMLYAGRGITILLGGVLIALALVAPQWGGAEVIIVKVGSLCVGPLLLPILWALFSRRLTSSAMWLTVALGLTAGMSTVILQSWNVDSSSSGIIAQLVRWLQENPRHADMLVGLALPVFVLGACEIFGTASSQDWSHFAMVDQSTADKASPQAAVLPVRVVGWTLTGTGLLIGSLSAIDREQTIVLATFAAALLAAGFLVLRLGCKLSRSTPSDEPQSAQARTSNPSPTTSWATDASRRSPVIK